MTLANLKKLHAHFSWLASGVFTESDFNYKLKKSDNPNGKKGGGGSMSMGDMNAARIDLIKSDAQRHLDDLEAKHPNLKPKPKSTKKDTPEELPETPKGDK